jgi:hypothetical protein
MARERSEASAVAPHRDASRTARTHEGPRRHLLRALRARRSRDRDAAPRPDISIEEIVISLVGAALLAVIFAASAAQQRSDLQRLLEQTFSEVPRL